jgi:hypothetical protein
VSAERDPSERIRTLLLRGDNVLKSSSPDHLGRALEAFEQAGDLAADKGVEPRVRELVARRIASVQQLIDGAV